MFVDTIIVDSGINACFQDCVVGGINLTGDRESCNIFDSIGHGSSVLGIIKQKNLM